MKKTLLMILAIFFVFNMYAQDVVSTKVVEVTNYNEVVSSILYPLDCKKNGIEGTVIVSLEVDKEGKLINHEFISSPCRDFTAAVTNALPQLIFKPATDEQGNAITSKITMPVSFVLTI